MAKVSQIISDITTEVYVTAGEDLASGDLLVLNSSGQAIKYAGVDTIIGFCEEDTLTGGTLRVKLRKALHGKKVEIVSGVFNNSLKLAGESITPWDVSLAGLNGNTLSFPGISGSVKDFKWKNSGQLAFVLTSSKIVYKFAAATPYTTTSASLEDSQQLPNTLNGQVAYYNSLDVADDGTYFSCGADYYNTGQTRVKGVARWSLGTAWVLSNDNTLPSGTNDIGNYLSAGPSGECLQYGSITSNRGFILYYQAGTYFVRSWLGADTSNGGYSLTSVVDFDPIEIGGIASFWLDPAGNLLFIAGDNKIVQYSLASPWALTGATATGIEKVGVYTSSPPFVWRPDGLKFWSGLNEYELGYTSQIVPGKSYVLDDQYICYALSTNEIILSGSN